MSLNAIANKQSCPTEMTKERVLQFLDYMATHPDAIVRFKSDMILNVHSDASYLSAPKAHSQGYFFLRSLPIDVQPVTLNGAIQVIFAPFSNL
jgi:hypothetical protein